jgi:hypothetical protein
MQIALTHCSRTQVITYVTRQVNIAQTVLASISSYAPSSLDGPSDLGPS